MTKTGKNARFYNVSKHDGNGESWSYFVPGQNVDSVKLGAKQQHVATEVTPYGWYAVFVEVDHDGVFFSAMIGGQEWTYRQREQGYGYLTTYLGPEYDDANRSYFS